MNLLKKIFQYLGYFQLLVGLIKPVKEAIETVEQPGNGALKKQAVLQLLNEVILTAEKAVPGLDLPEDMILGFVDGIIDVIVAFYNLTGKFKHATEGKVVLDSLEGNV